jgi:hypothetical protein
MNVCTGKDAVSVAIDAIPPSDAIRKELAEIGERTKLLRKMLRLADQRERLLAIEGGARDEEPS